MKGPAIYFIFDKRLAVCVCLSFMVSSFLFAQDFKEALLKMKQEYADAPNLHIVMSIKAYDKNSPSTIFYNQKAEVKKADQKYYYSLDQNEMLLNTSFLILVNHKLKQIDLRKNSLTDSQFEYPAMLNLDSMLSVFGTALYIGKKNGLDQYRVVHKVGGMLKQTELFFKSETGQLQQVGYEYVNGQYVSIQFDLFDKSPQFDADTFSEKKYVRTLNGKVVLEIGYQHYIINAEQTD